MRLRVNARETGLFAPAPAMSFRGFAVPSRSAFGEPRERSSSPQAPQTLPASPARLILPPVYPGGGPMREPAVQNLGEALGEDFSSVRITPRSHEAEELGALAFARGEEVHFAPGQYRPQTPAGLRLLGHELVHVAQQRLDAGAAPGEGDREVNEDPHLERQAEQVGALASRGAAGIPASPGLPPRPPRLTPAPVGTVQRARGPKRLDKMDQIRARHRHRQEVERLARSPTDSLARHWRGLRISTGKTLAKIREIDQISQAHPRPRRLAAQDLSISNRLDQLSNQADLALANLDNAGRRDSQVLRDNKKALAEIILEATVLKNTLGQISSQAEQNLRQQDFAGDLTAHVYHTGSRNDPIPISWYKNPGTDYDPIVIPALNGAGVTPGTYHYPNGPTQADNFPVDLVVAARNRPVLNNAAAFEIVKQPLGSRPAQTPNQVQANLELAAAGFDLRTQHPQLDGDHVKDLGFGGADAFDNYWPLDQDINRRAFHGYNANYQVNYIDHTKDAGQVNLGGNPNGRPVLQSIGGMAGRYFVIKRFMANNEGNIPDESGTEDAGTV
jgi:hypothetical protein